MRDLRKKIRIAHLAGPNATIQNTPPLVTSNKARAKHGLELMTDVEAQPVRFDVLRPQKLAKPAKVYVEQFSAHPLEADAVDLYGPPDGFLTPHGDFVLEREGPSDTPVFEVVLDPDDGYYPLPYMARQADGSAWEFDGVSAVATRDKSRQPFMPDGRRTFDEIDRLGVDAHGHGNVISSNASVDFYRIAPSGGYTRGQTTETTNTPPERSGHDFYPYRPVHLQHSPPRMMLARIANHVQKILDSGNYDGAIWTQGSPRIEETIYWFQLVLDTTVPICGNAAQRYHGTISNDGPKNIADSVDWIESRLWADEQGRNHTGMVLVQDQRVFAAREVTKGDARPGGYLVAGGHGGVLGAANSGEGCSLRFIPVVKQTYRSELNVTRLPLKVTGIGASGAIDVDIKDADGRLVETSIPKVSIVKDSSYAEDDWENDPVREVEINALIDYKRQNTPLAGFVLEGLSPYGKAASTSKTRALTRAIFSGYPVVGCGRGNTEGFAIPGAPFIAGSNLTSTKARILLMACIMKLGMLPAAVDPGAPTDAEKVVLHEKVRAFQRLFDTH